MSKGLGKIQRQLLVLIAKKKGKDGWASVQDLVVKVYHPERFDEVGDCWDWTYSRAEYVTIHRAIDSLERRGLVETKRHASSIYKIKTSGQGGAMIARMVRLKC